jgi:hypothetical protein
MSTASDKHALTADLMLGVSVAYIGLCQALIESGALKPAAIVAKLAEMEKWGAVMGHPTTAQWLSEIKSALDESRG